MKTIAAVARIASAPFSIEEVDLPELGPKDVLIRVAGVGICHTDLASRDGVLGAPFPAIFGHEGSGVVERVGAAVTKVVPGDHVVLAPDSDGTCLRCQHGDPMYCDSFTILNFQASPNGPSARLSDGASARIKYFGQSSFARFAIAGERNTVKVRDDVDLHLLGPLGCGIQTGAGTVITGLKPAAGSSIAILGTGAVGLAALLGAVTCGCATIVAVDRVPARLELARSLGATHIIDTGDGRNIGETIRAIAPAGVDFVVDAAGVPFLISQAMAGLAPRGTLGLIAVPPANDQKVELPWLAMLLAGQNVQGFIEGDSIPDEFIPRLIDLFKQGRFPFDRLITDYPFSAINQAVEDQQRGVTIKAVLRMDLE